VRPAAKSEARRLEEQAKTTREHHARVNLLGYTVAARRRENALQLIS
jgi:hypothetical protein